MTTSHVIRDAKHIDAHEMNLDRYLGHMSLSHLIKYGLSLPPHIALAKALDMTKRRLRGRWRAHSEKHQTTFVERSPVQLSELTRLTNLNLASLPTIWVEGMKALCEKTMAQEFDLLGSGWTNVAIATTASDNPVSDGNKERAVQIRSLISPDYRPIDWHSDFKSGYRWSAAMRAESIVYGHEPGVDIKVPWELARMQHLPPLAFAYGNALKRGDQKATRFVDLFCDQALDFISSNPPGYGVNWSCTMDVAIRAANLALAFDLFRSFDAAFSQEFIEELIASLTAHATHIVQNLETGDGFRGNHYLADIVGLLIVSALLPSDDKSNSWLAFAIGEFVEETGLQFHADGSNAEASTNYHRLSAEMVVYATAVALGLPKERRKAIDGASTTAWSATLPQTTRSITWSDEYGAFTAEHFHAVRKMAMFTCAVTKPNGQVAQIGDTDNGRLFKLQPVFLASSVSEGYLDHSHLIAAIGGLLNDDDLIERAGPANALEVQIVQSLKQGGTPKLAVQESSSNDTVETLTDQSKPATRAHRLIITLPDASLCNNLESTAFPDFGLYIWRSQRFYLAIRCGAIGQAGNGGHAHNDQLSIELQIDGEDWLADPGTGVYTANTKTRDLYRSHLAHFGPRLQTTEPSRLDLGLFRLEDNTNAACLLFTETEFLGRHEGYNTQTYRHIRLAANQIEITDTEGGSETDDQTTELTRVQTRDDLRQYFGAGVAYSRGYGWLD